MILDERPGSTSIFGSVEHSKIIFVIRGAGGKSLNDDMFGEKATDLIKELLRESIDTIPKYNEESVEHVIQEIIRLFDKNMEEVSLSTGEDMSYFPGVQFRHSCIEYNKRCLLAYLIGDLSLHRWEVGSVLGDDLKSRLSKHEVVIYIIWIEYFYKYCQNLENYIQNLGLDITKYSCPPKALNVEIRCLEDIGEVVLPDGHSVNLKKDTQHYLPRNFCESFLKQGLFEQITD
ncbi:DNA replication complex GINS protein PSF1 [Thelohanellus kitauei]|uniref:DNA replication complex GINS protein PSF1 n=1 Tax=Thelohanellus kitauei TaxID=669202 RepID=A0A0C2ITE0_THEKT|nr:DNA replication complex GINS protein PSF1 [Thelohanellus kitauei]